MKKPNEEPQVDRFEQAARALECDKSEEQFDGALRNIAAHKVPHSKKGVGRGPEAEDPSEVPHREPE